MSRLRSVLDLALRIVFLVAVYALLVLVLSA